MEKGDLAYFVASERGFCLPPRRLGPLGVFLSLHPPPLKKRSHSLIQPPVAVQVIPKQEAFWSFELDGVLVLVM